MSGRHGQSPLALTGSSRHRYNSKEIPLFGPPHSLPWCDRGPYAYDGGEFAVISETYKKKLPYDATYRRLTQAEGT